ADPAVARAGLAPLDAPEPGRAVLARPLGRDPDEDRGVDLAPRERRALPAGREEARRLAVIARRERERGLERGLLAARGLEALERRRRGGLAGPAKAVELELARPERLGVLLGLDVEAPPARVGSARRDE